MCMHLNIAIWGICPRFGLGRVIVSCFCVYTGMSLTARVMLGVAHTGQHAKVIVQSLFEFTSDNESSYR